ncbi:DeoR/GlpR family DNA-binding transcription regulator [Nocardiopsis sp. MG754419]|uniref:DeoR/GlpR family DNA-binding transcription regulator n=1 Tax=Nocardiopsis sp. MG754419 TaxID=2259865 RepID=UPI001BA9CB26|nr:DeoR/GlpR family DNA-binding transcription regulator [Nocardiopsis sp. MG754419]MBR8743040.1 DeoR/GlpR transcriptional regulator [Nocardiopsis sp. MG754419]
MSRHRRVLDAVLDGTRRVEDLAALLGVSPSTVRRALGELEDEGRVVRTRGGAVPVGALAHAEPSWTEKQRRRVPAKRAIAEHAAALVQDHHVVLLDAGSTTTFIAERLADRRGPTVVTNGIGPMTALQHAEGVEVIVTGGHLRRPRGSLAGDLTRVVLDRIGVDIAFVGVDGLDPERGLNCPTAEIGALKELLMRSAPHTVLVTDSSKLGVAPHHHWAPVPGPYTLVTDDGLDPGVRTALESDRRCALVALPPRTPSP